MTNQNFVLTTLLLVTQFSAPQAADAQRVGAAGAQVVRPEVASGAYFVGFQAGVQHQAGLATVRNLGANVTAQYPEVRAVAIRVAGEAVAQAVARNPQVAYVEPVPMRYALGLEDAQLVPAVNNGLYGLLSTRAIEVHARGISGQGINVGVADTGLDYTHPDIALNYRGGIDTIGGDNDPIWETEYDYDWGLWVVEKHGTHVAGTVLAANNAMGVLGVAYSANLYHARVLGPWGGTAETVMDGVRWLVETAHCKVVNLSLGGQLPSTTEESFYQEMRNRGVLIVCSAGNNSATTLSYPAGYASTIAVGAVDVSNQRATFSNTGSGLDVSAPGVGVLSSVPVNQGFAEAWVQTTQTFAANALSESGITQGITRPFINCARGKTGEFPLSVWGNIALIGRGDITFMEKVTNAMNAGAVAVIIYNNVPGNFQAYLDPGNWIPAVSVSDTDGAILVSQAGSTGTVIRRFSSWDWYNGTSMAAPHVTGVLTLMWSVNPAASNDNVEDWLFTTCQNLGPAGYDTTFGHGLVDAYAAVARAESPGSPPPAPVPSLQIGDVTVAEGNVGAMDVIFDVTLSTPSDKNVTFRYTTADSTALAGTDYEARFGQLTIPAGQTTAALAIAVYGDRIAEPSESFFVRLTDPTNATIASGQGRATIADNEPRIDVGDTSLTEGNSGTKYATFTVTLSAAYDQSVTAYFATQNGSATAGIDYQAASGTLTFAPGQTSRSVAVTVYGDTQIENNEDVWLVLSNPSGNALIGDGSGYGLILNDDTRPPKGGRRK